MVSLVVDLSVLDREVLTGVERRALQVARRLPGLLDGWEILFAAPARPARAGGLDLVGAGSVIPRAVWRRTVLPRIARRSRADVVLSFVAHCPRTPGSVTVRTVHDVSPDPRGRKLRLLARQQATVCVSDATRRELDRVAPSAAPRRVIHNGVDERFFAIDRDPGPLVLIIGSVRPRRNPDVVDAAAALLRAERPELRVVWVGAGAGRGHAVEWAGPLDDADVDDLMARAAVLVSPSTVEGFGIPVVEALAAGVPVVAADSAAVREVAGDHASFYAPRDAAALAAAVAGALDAPPDPAPGRARAREFSWERCALEHAAFVGELQAARRHRDASR